MKGCDYSAANAFYVTICTQNRARLFGELPKETLVDNLGGSTYMVEKWLLKISTKFDGTFVTNYVVMPNHIHFIVVLEGGHMGPPLPEIIEWFKTMTTNEYIRGVNDGHFQPFAKRLWQRNYYEHIIRSEVEYQHIWQYIDENPVRWEYDELNRP